MNYIEPEYNEELEVEEVTIDRVPADYRDPRITPLTFLLAMSIMVVAARLPLQGVNQGQNVSL